MTEILRSDVLIIGGGPAGLAAAKAASDGTLRVTVLEKSLEIGYPIHTSGGSWTRELRALGVPEQYIHPIRTLQFISSGNEASFDYDFPEICVIDIRAVYQNWAEQASLQGAVIHTNTLAQELLYEEGKLCGVKAVRNGNPIIYKAKVLIDASGFSALVARQSGLSSPSQSYGKGAEYEIVTKSWSQDKTAILLGSAFTPVGYGWVFPYGKHRVRVGVGVLAPYSKAEPMPLLEAFLAGSHPLAQKLQPYSILETHFGSVPNSGYIAKSYADNLLIAGDAAGQVLGLAGEGIRLAYEIGMMAGQTAAEAIAHGDTSEQQLARYETLWKKKFARSIDLNARLNGIVSSYTDAQWDRALDILKDVDPEIVLALMKGYFDLRLVKLILSRNPGLFAHNAMKIIRKAVTGS